MIITVLIIRSYHLSNDPHFSLREEKEARFYW